MKKHRRVGTNLTAGTFFLIGTLAVAQAPQRSRTTSPHGATANQPAGMAVDHAGGNGVRRMAGDPGQSGNNPMYEGNGAAVVSPASGGSQPQTPNSMKEVHATEVITPVYESFGMSRRKSTNEGKGQANIKPGAGASAAPYKDPEDMTTRYRPGNNKTTRMTVIPAKAAVDAVQPQKNIEHAVGQRASDRSLGSAHATESLGRSNSGAAPSGQATSDVVQERKSSLHEDSGKSGSNPMYESGKNAADEASRKHPAGVKYESLDKQGDHNTGGMNTPDPTANEQGPLRKHIAGVKYEDRSAANSNGGANTPGFAVNEQGSSTSQNTGKRHHR